MRLLLGPHAAAVRSRRPPAAGRRTMNSSRLSGLVTAACAACVRAGDTTPARAWVYPEHRDIAVLAVNGLDPERRAAFDRLWGQARTGYEQRLCAHGADTAQALAPECIDWAAFSAISGDHSCSSRGMLDTVLRSAWILQVADVAAQLKVDLGRIAVAARPEVDLRSPDLVGDLQRRVEDEAQRAERVNALRTADTRMQRADPQYATRAGSNNAHFLIPRPSTDTTAPEYAQLALSPGSEVNAIGVYTWFHLSALQKAARIASGTPAPAARDGLARAMLADEGFALHFLEDAYASGHVAGTWGDVSQRKGTHDYYNEAGLEAFTWRGSSNSMVLMGDAHMRPEDAERASHAVRASLDQVLDTATGRSKSVRLADPAEVPVEPDALDVCKTDVFERRPEGLRATRDEISLLADVLGPTPVPGLGQGLGSLPRFRAEIGPFVGVTGTLDLRNVSRGLVPGEDANGWIGGAELSLRAGLGLDGVMDESGDGLVYGSIGIRGDSRSSNKTRYVNPALEAANGSAAIPARFGIATRLRMPFYLIPGDLLFLAPVYLFSPKTYADMAVTAANGGLIPWQAGWATGIGRFQFVLGRELGATFYGRGFENTVVAPGAMPGDPARVVSFKSIHWDLPILEYRPYRAFDTKQSSAVLIQLFGGVEVPSGVHVTYPEGAPGLSLQRNYSLGLRMIFDWRRYF